MIGFSSSLSKALIRRLYASKKVTVCDSVFFRTRSYCAPLTDSTVPTATNKPIKAQQKIHETVSRATSDDLNAKLTRFKQTLEKNKPISPAFCTALISEATESQDWKIATFVYRKTKALNVQPDLPLFTAILQMFLRHSDLLKAIYFVDNSTVEITAKHVHGLFILAKQLNRFDLAMKSYELLKKKNIAVDAPTINILLGMCLRRNDRATAGKLLEDFKLNGIKDGQTLDYEMAFTSSSYEESLNRLMRYLNENSVLKDSKVNVLLNHLIETYHDELDQATVTKIYGLVMDHSGLNMRLGVLTVLVKLLGRSRNYTQIVALYSTAHKRGVSFDQPFYIEAISHFLGKKEEFVDKFLELMTKNSNLVDTLEFYSKLIIKCNHNPPAVFSLMTRVQQKFNVVDPKFALLFVLFLIKKRPNFEVIATDPALMQQVKAWKELIDVNYDTTATMLQTAPNKFWGFVDQCRGLLVKNK